MGNTRYLVNLSIFKEASIICNSDEVRNEIYHRIADEFLVSLKWQPLSKNVTESKPEKEIEQSINFRRAYIAALISFAFRVELGIRRELKTVGIYLDGCSLLDVISVNWN
jgi:hypothetical protein